MPIFEKQGQRIAFIHIPKAAGSSIERYFADLGWTTSFFLPCTDPNVPSDHHLTYSVLRERIPDLDEIPSFCIVRNPYQRIVSEWRWHRTVMSTTMLSFPDFVRRMAVSLQTTQTYWDNHWRPQSDFLADEIDTVVRLENLHTEFAEFLQRQGMDPSIKLPHEGRTKHRFRRTLRPKITPDTINRIRELYAVDFERLGYSTVEAQLQ